MGDLNKQTLARKLRDSEYEVHIDQDWEVWGPNGGYLSALLLRAVGLHAGKDMPVTFSGQYLRSPAFGRAVIVIDSVKDGRNAAMYNARLLQQDVLVVQAQVWVCNRGNALEQQLTPRPAHWQPLADAGPRPPCGPMRFWSNLEIRGVKNDAGFYSHWYRFAPQPDIEDPFVDAARSLILIDTMQWPARYHMESEPPPYVAPSLDLYVQFHRFNPHSQWLFSDARSLSAAHGLISGSATVWDEDGNLLASGGSQSLLRAVTPTA